MNHRISVTFVLFAGMALSACQQIPVRTDTRLPAITEALDTARSQQPVVPAEPPKAVQDALLGGWYR